MAIVRIFQIAKELNISHTDIVDFLNKKDCPLEQSFNNLNHIN